jgi:hypothetical protein
MCFMQNIHQQRRRSVFFGVEFRVELLYLHPFLLDSTSILFIKITLAKKNRKLK